MSELARNLNLTVVLLEDEIDQREGLSQLLRDLTKWDVVAVADSQECLDLVNKRHPSVAILDVEISESDLQGNDVARQIFRNRKGGWLPIVVMLTKYSALEIRNRNNPLGDAFIQKEYFLEDPGALVVFIDKVYEAREAGLSLGPGPLIYDPEKHGMA